MIPKKTEEKLKEIVASENVAKILVRDDPYSVILARAFLLFLLTFDVFLNAYVMMSLDRNDLMIGLMTIVVSIVGQFAAITGQFGYKIGRTLLHAFVGSDLLLLVLSILMEQMAHNFMTKISFTLSGASFLVALFIVIKASK